MMMMMMMMMMTMREITLSSRPGRTSIVTQCAQEFSMGSGQDYCLLKIQGRISRSTSNLPLSLVFELFYSGLRR